MSDLKVIQELGEQLAALHKKKHLQEYELQDTKDSISALEEIDLPALMDEIGVTDLTLACGGKISCKDLIFTRLKDPATAFAWLREHQGDGIIKNEIKVTLNRGEDDRADMIKADLTTRGVAFEHKETIHASTLKAYVTETLNGDLRDSLRREAFGVHEGRKVTFK